MARRPSPREQWREAESRYRALVEMSPDAVFVHCHGKLIFINPAGARLLGAESPEQLVGKPVLELAHPRDRAVVEERIRRAEAGLTNPPLEEKLVRMDGSAVDVEVTGGPLTYRGRPAVQVIARDIGERKRTHEAFRRSEGLLQVIFENAFIGIAVTDLRGRFIKTNWAFQKMLGYGEDELGGLALLDIVHPEHVEASRAIFQELVEGTRERFQIEKRYLRKDGAPIWVRNFVSVTEGSEGVPRHAIAVVEDITERRLAEEELKRTTEQLRALSRRLQSVREEERTRISRQIHDELGQALTAAKMDLAWLDGTASRKSGPDAAAQRKEKMASLSALLDGMIERVREISTDLRPAVLDHLGLDAAVEWQAQQFRSRTGIPCRLSVRTGGRRLDPDRETEMFRIFQEILTNVARHARASRVAIRLERSPGKLFLRVSDDGRGIAREEIDSPRSLGLLGIRERARLLGGGVEIRGTAGKGTTVIVEAALAD